MSMMRVAYQITGLGDTHRDAEVNPAHGEGTIDHMRSGPTSDMELLLLPRLQMKCHRRRLPQDLLAERVLGPAVYPT